MTRQATDPVPQSLPGPARRQRTALLPDTVAGWCTLALLVVTAAAPLWWAPVESVLHNNWVQVGGAVLLAVASLVLGAVQVFARKDYAVLLVLALVAVTMEVALVAGVIGLLALGLVQLE